MQTYTIEVADNVLESFLKALNAFSKNDIKIIKKSAQEPINKVVENDSLSGMFSHYVTHRLSDDEISDGIAQGAYERAMRGLNEQ